VPPHFGTDGVRGVAGEDLTADLAASIARAAVLILAADGARPLVVVGRDPRPSGPWLQDAVVAGLTEAGADVALLGMVPTPAVARAVADGLPNLTDRPTFGIVISASHNPARDNGIKLFGPGGVKLTQAVESMIEARIGPSGPARDGSGRVRLDLSGRIDWYVEALHAAVPDSLEGLRVVVDCANGAASSVAEAAYSGAGATVTLLNTDLSGVRINDGCGATHLETIREAVRATAVDIGIAHDGDADRCLAVTASGEVVDGDAILAILALDANARGLLRGNAIAATVMSNLGLLRAMRSRGIEVATTAVGDRAVTERMRADGLAIGGEQSGHLVLLDHASTGDGLLTGLSLLATMARSGRSLEDLASVLERLPQVLLNVPVVDPAAAMRAVEPVAQAAARELGEDGRVLVRPSGTEPLVRVMVEALTEERATQIAARVAAEVPAPR